MNLTPREIELYSQINLLMQKIASGRYTQKDVDRALEIERETNRDFGVARLVGKSAALNRVDDALDKFDKLATEIRAYLEERNGTDQPVESHPNNPS